MTTSPVVIAHVFSAAIALLSGLLAMMLRKGSGLHGAAGTVFFISMIGMTTTGGYAAIFIKPVRLNAIVAIQTLYLVVTAWLAAKRREKTTGIVDIIALGVACGVAVAGIGLGIQGSDPSSPRPALFIFGTVGTMFAVSDVRLLIRGGVAGTQRIRRHLWRMSLALLFTIASLYPGRPRLFSPAWQHNPLIFAPHVFVIVSMTFWMIRLRHRRNHGTEEQHRASRWHRLLPSPAVRPVLSDLRAEPAHRAR